MNTSESELQPALPSLVGIFKYVVASVLVIHLFGLFGIFVALAYPLWWFFNPRQTFCFFCLHTKIRNPQGTCPVCKKKVTSIYDPPFRAVFFNMLAILTLSLLSLFVVFVELSVISGRVLRPGGYFLSRRAVLSLPEDSRYYLGRDLYYDLKLSSTDIPINVVQADLYFPKELLKVKEIQTGQSFATIFTHKEYSNTEGWVRILGGLPNPGYVGENGLFARIYFEPVKTGAGSIGFLESSKILANDGQGTNVLRELASSDIIIENEREVLGAKSHAIIPIWSKLTEFFHDFK